MLEQSILTFFDGFGTMILSHVIAIVLSGFVGFRIGRSKSKFKQSQKAGSDSEQYQRGNARLSGGETSGKESVHNKFRQSQKAGDKAKQTQIGGIDGV